MLKRGDLFAAKFEPPNLPVVEPQLDLESATE
jgi:hypothetical protein